VASTYARKWFSAEEQKVAAKNSADIGQQWVYYRLRGDKCGNVPFDRWQGMSVFERNCWYWSYWNQTIQKYLSHLSSERWMMVRIEKLSEQWDAICRFLNVAPVELGPHKSNASKLYPPDSIWAHIEIPVPYDRWHSHQKKQFEDVCGKMMDAIYSNWRDVPLSL
jgi:hypothetical protein